MTITKIIVLFVFILALSACGGSSDDPAGINTDNASPLALQDLVTGTIQPGDSSTSDLYRVQVDQNKTYSIDLFIEQSVTSLPGHIRVFNKEGTLLLPSNLASTLLTSYFEFSTGNNTEVFIEVSIEYPSSIHFQYQLAIYPSSDNGLLQDSISYEPNNTLSTAHPLALQQTIDNALAAGTLDHRDIYAVDVLEGQTYTVMTTFTNGISTGAGTELQLSVSDDLGTLFVNEQSIAYEQTTYNEITPQQTGKLYIALFSPRAAQDRYYGYQLTVLPAADNGLVQNDLSYEPNNSATTAYPINLETLYTSDLQDGTEDHMDFYSIDVTAGETYSVMLSNDTGVHTGVYNFVYLTVNESDGTVLLDENAINNSSSNAFEFVATQDTQAVISIYPHSQRLADSFQYRLLVTPSAGSMTQDSVSFEPNETPSTATPISLSTTVQSELSTDISDRYDYFSLPVQNGTNYQLHLDILTEPGTIGSALKVSVRSPTGSEWLIEQNVTATGNVLDFTAFADSDAVVKIEAPANYLDRSYIYDLRIEPAP